MRGLTKGRYAGTMGSSSKEVNAAHQQAWRDRQKAGREALAEAERKLAGALERIEWADAEIERLTAAAESGRNARGTT